MPILHVLQERKTDYIQPQPAYLSCLIAEQSWKILSRNIDEISNNCDYHVHKIIKLSLLKYSINDYNYLPLRAAKASFEEEAETNSRTIHNHGKHEKKIIKDMHFQYGV